MSSAPDNSVDQTREVIVAYLDGELPEPQCVEVERRLAEDSAYRQELKALQSAWDALDVLPLPTVGEAFARSTIEMVTGDVRSELFGAAQDNHSQLSHFQMRARWLGGVCVLFAAAALGFAMVANVPTRNDRLLQDLPIVENLKAFRAMDSIIFLRALNVSRLFAETPANASDAEGTESETAGETRNTHSAPPPLMDAQTLADIASWSDARKEQLRSNQIAFERLAPHRQKQMRDLRGRIEAEENADELMQVMTAYATWRMELTPGQLTDLDKLPVKERIERIANIKKQRKRKTPPLRRTDMKIINQWLLGIAKTRWEQMSEGQRKKISEFLPRLGRPRQRPQSSRDQLLPFIVGIVLRGRADLPITAQEYEELVNSEGLSEETKQTFVDTKDEKRRLELLRPWFFASIMEHNRPRHRGEENSRPSEEELQRFFVEDLDDATREQLIVLPTSEMRDLLTRMYRGVYVPIAEWSRQRGLGGRSPGGRGRPGGFGPPGSRRGRGDGQGPGHRVGSRHKARPQERGSIERQPAKEAKATN